MTDFSCKRGAQGGTIRSTATRACITPPDEDNGILAKLGGGDVARAVTMCGDASRAPPGAERTVLIGCEYHGAVRVRCKLHRLKRHRNTLVFWSAVSAEPR